MLCINAESPVSERENIFTDAHLETTNLIQRSEKIFQYVQMKKILIGDIYNALIMIPSLLISKDFHEFYDALQEKKIGKFRAWDKFFKTLIYRGCQIFEKLDMTSSRYQTAFPTNRPNSQTPIIVFDRINSNQTERANKRNLIAQSISLNTSIDETQPSIFLKKLKEIHQIQYFSRFAVGDLNATTSNISIKAFIERAFQGNYDQYKAFLDTLNSGLPRNSSVFVRGSSITGYNWRTGKVFDAFGVGSSDLDIVLVGHEIINYWKPENFIIPLHYTKKLIQETAQASLKLSLLQNQLEYISQREVNIQGASGIYLTLRLFLQDIHYLKLLQK